MGLFTHQIGYRSTTRLAVLIMKIDHDFIIVFRNCLRYECLELSIKTAKMFVPESSIFCVDMHVDDYTQNMMNLIPLPPSQIFPRKTKYVARNRNNVESWRPGNCLFFSEGYNVIYDIFKDYDGKLFACNEDQFFTNGNTINELKQNEFDFAWANWCWPDENTVNGSIFCFNPSKCSALFPMPEDHTYVDKRLYQHIVETQHQHGLKLYKMLNRVGEDYKGDGIRVTTDRGYSERQQMIEYLQVHLPSIL